MADFSDPGAATVGGSQNTWGDINNARFTAIINALLGTTQIQPDLKASNWQVGSTTVTATAAELNKLASLSGNILTDAQSDTLGGGFSVTDYNAGTKSSGTYTPDPADGNFQYAVNGGAHTLAPPATSCSMVIQYTNNASAGAITTSGFTAVKGSFTTTNGDDFMCSIVRCNDFSLLVITALQ